MTPPSTASDFEVAKKITDELETLDRDRRERVLRWVAESLGLAGTQNSPPFQPQGPPAPGAAPAPPQPAQGANKDIRAFVNEKDPKSENQFAAVVAYYYRFEAPASQRKNTIGGADLTEAARLAGRKRLSNPRQTLKNAKNMGYLDNVGRGAFSINTVGENLVAMTLPGGAADAGMSTRSRRGKRVKSKAKSKAKARSK